MVVKLKMKDFLDCIISGKCKQKDYDYTFYLNNEEIKADKCFTTRFEGSYCKKDGVVYNNVSYSKVLVNEYYLTREPFYKNNEFSNFVLPILIFIIFQTIFLKLFEFIKIK